MSSYEAIFGTIRSLINRADYHSFFDAMCEQLDAAYELEPERCVAELCPYVEHALANIKFWEDDYGLSDNFELGWEQHVPSLMTYMARWPSQAHLFDRLYEVAPKCRPCLIVDDFGPDSFRDLARRPWANNIGAIWVSATPPLNGIAAVADFPAWEKLTVLDIFEPMTVEIFDQLLSLPLLQNIESITIHSQGYTDAHFATMQNCLPKLKKLSTYGSHITGEGIRHLATHPSKTQLEELSVDGSSIEMEHLLYIFSTPSPNLRRLGLEHTSLDNETIIALAKQINAPKLEELDLGSNYFSASTMAQLGNLYTSNLRSLILNTCSLNKAAVEQIISNQALSQVRELYMQRCRMDDDTLALVMANLGQYTRYACLDGNDIGQQSIRAFANNKNIQDLDSITLGDSKLDDEAIETLQHAHCLPNLEYLHLNNCGASNEALARLLYSNRLNKLKCYNLNNNNIGEAFFEALHQTQPVWDDLTLYLNHNDLDESSLSYLAKWPGMTGVRCLNLENNPQLSDATEGWRQLGLSPHINTIRNIISDDLSDETQRALQKDKQLPDRFKKLLKLQV